MPSYSKQTVYFWQANQETMSNSYFKRYVWLLNTIMQHGHITQAEVSDLWQRSSLNENGSRLPPRTFHNHREAILNLFGIEIRFDKGQGYYIANEDINANGIRNWLMTSLSVNNLINESTSLSGRIILEESPSGQDYLKIIINAMNEGKMLEMDYQRFQDTQPSRMVIAPYSIKLFKQRWYVAAKPSDQQQLRIYALDRIQNLSQTRKSFIIPESFSAKEFFGNWFGIVRDEINYKPATIRLKVWKSQCPHLRTVKLHESQREIETHDNWSIFEYFMVPTWELEQELLQYHDCVEVLEPQSLRESMIEHAQDIMNLHNSEKEE